MKTVEEIYNKYFHHTDDNTKRLILICMKEYASQFKTVEPEKCKCGSIDTTTRYGIDQCRDCGKPA